MSLLADSIIDWGALLQVVYISAAAGIAIALVLGIGITAQLRAENAEGGTALGLNLVTIVSVLLTAAALVVGIYYITDKS
jgi:hypothetical protein